MAGAELSVSFLPKRSCLYRHYESAMSNTTNLFESELVTHLFKKHRVLIEKYPPKRHILGVNRSQFEKEVGLIPLTRNQPNHEKDSGYSKDHAPTPATSARA